MDTTTATTVETTPGVFVSPAEYAMTRDKIEKINARAAKKGFTGSYDLVAIPATRNVTSHGISTVEHGFEVTLTGTAPSYNGWTLLGRVDAEEAGLVIATVPGVEGIDRDALVAGHCAHCQTNRTRRSTYIVRGEDGVQIQVGSTCIKDFLGWKGQISFLSEDDVESEIFGGGFGGGERAYEVLSVLALAWATISVTGYVRADSYENRPTGSLVRAFLGNGRLTEYEISVLRAVHAKSDEAEGHAFQVRDFILSDEFAGDSEYVQNLKVIVAGETVTGRSLGLLISAPQALIRYNEQIAKRDAEAAEKETMVNEFVGEIKDKVEVTVTVKAIRYIHGDYGTTTLYTMVSDTGHSFKWFSSAGSLGDDEGVTVRIKGTVKAHEEFQGRKSTVLTRCKVIEEAAK